MLINHPTSWTGWTQTQRDSNALDTFSEATDYDLVDFRTRAAEMVEYLGRDYAAIKDHGEDLFETQIFPLRYVPLVWRFARTMAPLYVRPPTRTVKGVQASTRKRLLDLYAAQSFDLFMRSASRLAVVANSLVVSCDPVDLGVRWRLWGPHEVQIAFDDPLEDDIRKATRVDLRVPLEQEAGKVTYGRRVYTQDEAWTMDVDGKKKIAGVFNEQGTNPYDGIPLRAYRRDPENVHKGIWFPEICEDLRSLQIGVCLVLSFVEHIGRVQGFTMRALVGPGAKNAAEEMTTGPDYMVALAGDDMDLSFHDPNPPSDKTLKALETTLRLWGASNFVNVETLLSASTGITGDAKALEMQDSEEIREELQADMQALETDIAGLTLEVLAGVGLPRIESGKPMVSCEYHYVKPARNELQTVQAKRERYSLLLDDPIRDISQERGVSLAEAKQIFGETAKRLVEVRKAQLEVGVEVEGVPSEGDNNIVPDIEGEAPAVEGVPGTVDEKIDVNLPGLVSMARK